MRPGEEVTRTHSTSSVVMMKRLFTVFTFSGPLNLANALALPQHPSLGATASGRAYIYVHRHLCMRREWSSHYCCCLSRLGGYFPLFSSSSSSSRLLFFTLFPILLAEDWRNARFAMIWWELVRHLKGSDLRANSKVLHKQIRLAIDRALMQ